MRACARPEAPAWLAERAPEWTERWLARLAAQGAFAWPQYEREVINVRLVREALGPMTDHHCAYCDHGDLLPVGYETIDHFQPKSARPELAFAWPNLYLACARCQGEKRERWDDGLLRPDGQAFTFDRYFVYAVASGELAPNPAAPPEDRRRAEVTIELLGLNRADRPAARRRALKTHADLPMEERHYRFLW